MDNSYKSLSTPCFILDKEELEKSIVGFQDALAINFSNYIVGYSVKTNSTISCLHIACEKGCYAEVVSYDEYNLARKCGFSQNHIIFNGPMKSKDIFIDAILHGAIVNIECKRELIWLNDLPKDRSYHIGLRLNINISQISPSDANGENDNSRFGFSDETEEFSNAIDYINKYPNILLTGLHIHRTAHTRSLNFYKNSINYACQVIKKYDLKLSYLDVGGGYFGIFKNKPTYKDYSDIFKHALYVNHLENLNVIIEPGNALVASCFSFVCKVIDVKHIEKDRWFITTDGSRNDIDPFYKKTDYIKEIYSSRLFPIVKEQVISGCTCLESDRLFILKGHPLLNVGDLIVYHNVGAYTMCLSPLFIRYFPNIYMKDKDGYQLVREKWNVTNFIQKSIFGKNE